MFLCVSRIGAPAHATRIGGGAVPSTHFLRSALEDGPAVSLPLRQDSRPPRRDVSQSLHAVVRIHLR